MDRNQQLLTNMHTFSVAARCLSFTKAAEELYVTQGAVSQRIKQLEQQLGFSLFVRLTRRLELTPEGERLVSTLRHSFELIFSEIDDIKHQELSGEIYLGIAPTFAQAWLLKRLPQFQVQYPNLDIKIRVKASPLNFQHEPVDMAIYYSEDALADYYCHKLFDESLTPVCSANYYQAHFENTPRFKQESGITLIHCIEGLESKQPQFEWLHWFEQQSLSFRTIDVLTQRSIQVNHSQMAVEAAEQGLGIAMGRLSLVEDKLAEGTLVAPFKRVHSNRGYYLICPKGQQSRPRNQAFINWLSPLTSKYTLD